MDQFTNLMYSAEMQHAGKHVLMQTLGHPLDFAKTLMQMGYEPFPPTERTFILGTPYLALPNTFQYLKYIKSVDGFLGCYRGLAPRLCQGIVSGAVFRQISARNPFSLKCEPHSDRYNRGGSQVRLDSTRSGALVRGSQVADDFIGLMTNTGWEIISVAVATIASQPFYVICVRSMAQFVGRETKYNSIFSAITTIFQEEGILGFFAGVVPRLIGDVVYISLSASLGYLIRSYFNKETQGTSMEAGVVMLSNIVSSSFTYQFGVVATVMAVNNSSLAVGHYPFTKPYDDWYESWRALAGTKQLKRGSSIIGRYYTGPTVVVNGSRRPTGFHFGPQHSPGLGYKENSFATVYPYITKPAIN